MVIKIRTIIEVCTASDIPPLGLVRFVQVTTHVSCQRECDREWLVDKGFVVTASKAVFTDDRKITISR